MTVTRRDLCGSVCHFTATNPRSQGFEYRIRADQRDVEQPLHFVSYRRSGRWIYLGVFDPLYNSPCREGILRLTKASATDPVSHKAAEVFRWVAHPILWTGEPSLPAGYTVINHRESMPNKATKPAQIAVWEQVRGKEVCDFGDGLFPEPQAVDMLKQAHASDNPILQRAVLTTDGELYVY